MFVVSFLAEDDTVLNVPNKPHKGIEGQTPSQDASGWEINVEPVLKELSSSTRAHRDTPERSHLVLCRPNSPAMEETMTNHFFYITTERAGI